MAQQNYDSLDCAPGTENGRDIFNLGECLRFDSDDHRIISCSSSATPWAEVEEESIYGLYYAEDDNMCSDDIQTYVMTFLGVCHDYTDSSGLTVSSSNMVSCDSNNGTVREYDGGGCNFLSESSTFAISSMCNSMPYFSTGGKGKAFCTDSDGDDDDDAQIAIILSAIGASVVVAGIIGAVAYWLGYCTCCPRKTDADQLDTKLIT